MVEIEIIDKKRSIEKQKEDITTYHNMCKEIFAKLDYDGLATKLQEGHGGDYLIFLIKKSEKREVAQIHPSTLFEHGSLLTINVDVHVEEALDPIERTIRTYSEVYNHLEKAMIYTYF